MTAPSRSAKTLGAWSTLMPSSRRSLRARVPRAKKPVASAMTVGRVVDRVRAIAALADDVAHRKQLVALATDAGLPNLSISRLGALAAITCRVAADIEAAWSGDTDALERLRARHPPSRAVHDDDPTREAYVALALDGRVVPGESSRRARLALRAALNAEDRKAFDRLATLGFTVFRRLCITIFLNGRDTRSILEATWRALSHEQPIEVRRMRVLEAVRARSDVDRAIELLLDADYRFYGVDEDQLRAKLQSDQRRGDYATAATLSLLVGAFGDQRKPGEDEKAAVARIAHRYEVAAAKAKRSAPC